MLVYFEFFNTVQIAHACLRRIFQCGRVYLHFTENDIYICYMNFEINLIKKRFFLFPGLFWTVRKFLPTRSEAGQLAGSDKKLIFACQPCSKGAFLLYTNKTYIEKSCNYSASISV